jgi:hypothetical protein
LQLAGFPGTSANAVRWQVWTALPVYLLLRYTAAHNSGDIRLHRKTAKD